MKITRGSDKVVFCCLLIAAASLSLPARPEDPATLPHVGILTPPIPVYLRDPADRQLA